MTSMAPYFNVAPRFAMPELPGLPVSEEDRQRALLRNAYDSAAPRGPVPAMMSALSALRDMPEAAPAPRMVSGGDVIGLMPEQSAALMDRIQRQNEIDQQMYQQRSLQSREEAMTREGRVMSAREAQQRRAQEFAIEQAKLAQEDARDKAKMSQPTYQPISSKPGYLMKIQTNPDTNEVTAEVVKAGGVEVPKDPPKLTTVYDEAGNAIRKPDAEGLIIGQKPLTPAQQAQYDSAKQSRELRLMESMSKIPPDLMSNEKKTEALKAFRESGQIPQLEYVDKEHKHYQTDADGNLFINGVMSNPEGWQTKDKAGKSEKISEDLLRVAFKDNWNDRDANTQEKVNYLWAHGKSPEEIARVMGPPKEPGMLYGENERYSVPTVAPQSATTAPTPVTDQPQVGQGFDDEASIPEGAQVQDEQGRVLVKKNGKLVPVTGFGQ